MGYTEEKVKVSIIIPVYNCEAYVSATLESVLSQTLKEIEILCINDGSTDRSKEILEKYKQMDSRIQILEQENAGQSAARNKGMRVARGEYLYFLDSDDLITEDAMECLYSFAHENDLDVVYFNGTSFYDSEKLEEAYPQYQTYYIHKGPYDEIMTGPDLYAIMAGRNDFKPTPIQQMIRREHLLEKEIFFPEGIIHEDNFFAFSVLIQAGRAACLEKSLFRRRVRENSTMTKKKGSRNFIGLYVCACRILQLLTELELPENTLSAAAGYVLAHFHNLETMYDTIFSEEEKRKVQQDSRTAGIPYKDLIKIFTLARKEGILQEECNEERNRTKELKTQNDLLKESLDRESQKTEQTLCVVSRLEKEKKDFEKKLEETLQEKEKCLDTVARQEKEKSFLERERDIQERELWSLQDTQRKLEKQIRFLQEKAKEQEEQICFQQNQEKNQGEQIQLLRENEKNQEEQIVSLKDREKKLEGRIQFLECDQEDKARQISEYERQLIRERKVRKGKEKVIEDMQNSVSFKIGRFVTFLPRKLREILARRREK
ncbi:MAG: glycosyltransferase [Candidatus Limivivens sp.]|nr:glycosyltransferase [Candidatus Limivivens sp.]